VVGLEKKIIPDSFEGQIYSGDLFLLCSDGLTDRLTNEEIYKVLKSCGQEKEDLEDAAKRLLFSANKVGPGENTTVCLIKAKEEGKLLPKWQRQSLELHIAPGKKLKILPTS
jgi:protein phosphatase